MTLRWRTLITIAITLLGLITLVYISAEHILLSSFIDLEEQEMEEDLSRVVSAFDQYLLTLDTMNHEWAAWDDTYRFIENTNESYIVNFKDQLFLDMRLNLIILVNRENEVVYHKAFGPRRSRSDAVRDLRSFFARHVARSSEHRKRDQRSDHPTGWCHAAFISSHFDQ
jgi:sensor domain CHASE-containing protein